MQQPNTQKDNPLAVASLALGIFALTGASLLAAIPAIITGVMALKNPVNKGMGIAGIVMGVVSVVLTLLVILFFVFLFVIAGLSEPEYEGEPAPADDFTPSMQQRA